MVNIELWNYRLLGMEESVEYNWRNWSKHLGYYWGTTGGLLWDLWGLEGVHLGEIGITSP